MILGIGFDERKFLFADVAFGIVDDAFERKVVLTDNHAQIGDGIFDNGAAKEGVRALQLKGDFGGEQSAFDGSRKKCRTDEYGKLPIGTGLGLCDMFDGLRNPIGFGALVFCVMKNDISAAFAHRNERFRNSEAIARNESVCGFEDLGRASVVLHHADCDCAREIVGETEQAAELRAAPSIDGLIGVADDEKIVVMLTQNFHQAVLFIVDILEFVDHDVLELFLIKRAEIGTSIEDIERKLNDIVKIEGIAQFLKIKKTEEDGGFGCFCAVIDRFDFVGRMMNEQVCV